MQENKANKFLKLNKEKADFNQYWFSEKSIEFIINQIKKVYKNDKAIKIAFVSTPSIFFSLPEEIKDHSWLFEYDEKLLKKHKNSVFFDFNDFSQVDECHFNKYDLVIVDPPYINKPSWTQFANFVTIIAKKCEDNIGKFSCKILTCSIAENAPMLKELLNLNIKNYQPSIPNLVYQYNFFTNFDDEELDRFNEEIPNE